MVELEVEVGHQVREALERLRRNVREPVAVCDENGLDGLPGQELQRLTSLLGV